MLAIGVNYFSGYKRCRKNHQYFHGRIQLVKCCSPNIANLQSRATNFLKYVCSRSSLPRKYRTLPVISIGPPIRFAGGWIDIATNNSAVAATPRGSQADWRENTLPPPNICIPKYDQKLCARPVYDKWFDGVVLILAAGPFKTYGRAQKFLNLFVKYVYCVERSAAIATPPIHHSPGQTLVYECALHAPIDRRVLENLRQAWRKTQSWSFIKPILCNGNNLKAWSKISHAEYWQILCLLRGMINAMQSRVHPCGADAFGPFCACEDSQVKIPQSDFIQAVRACVDELNNEDPLVSVLDLEMRGLWSQ